MFAKRYPNEFMESLNDPLLKLQNKCASFINEGLLVIKNQKDVYYNIKGNKNKLLTRGLNKKHLRFTEVFFISKLLFAVDRRLPTNCNLLRKLRRMRKLHKLILYLKLKKNTRLSPYTRHTLRCFES